MDRQQFERIYQTHYQELVLHTNKLVKNKKIAEEIASDSFIKLSRLSNEIKTENAIWSILFTHAWHTANQYITNRKNEIQILQHYLDPIAISFGLEGELLNENEIQEVYANINTLHPRLKEVVELSIQGLSNAEIASKLGVAENTVSTLKNRAYDILRKVFSNNSTERPNDTHSSINDIQQINIIKDEINVELIKYFAKHPYKLYDLDPNKFEKLVAALMKDMGYDVYHTSQTRDGGRDIIAVMKTPANDQIVTIVECKRNRADRVVGIDIVERFIYTIRDKDKANAGWIVTTSSFSTDAMNKQQEYKWLLSLKDNKNLAAWCCNYGQWKRSGESGGLWLPNNPLA